MFPHTRIAPFAQRISLPFGYVPAIALYACAGPFLTYLDANNAITALHQSGGSWLAAGAAVAIDAARIALPVASRAYPQWRLAAFGAALTCLLYSAVSSFETVAANRTDASAGHAAANDVRTRVQAELDAAQAELKGLPHTRTPAEISGFLSANEVPVGIWARSKQCTDISRQDTKDTCSPFLTLKAEEAIAVHAEELRKQVKADSDKLATLPAQVTTDAGAALAASLPVAVTPEQARLLGSAVQILTFEVLASVLLSIAATAWAATGHKEGHGRAEDADAAETAAKTASPANGQPCGAAVGILTLSEPLDGQTATGGRGTDLAEALQAAGRPAAVQWRADQPATSQQNTATRQRPASEPQHGLAALLRVLSEVGGTFTGSQNELAELLGLNRSATRRLVHAAATQGLVALKTTRGHSTCVRILRPRLATAA